MFIPCSTCPGTMIHYAAFESFSPRQRLARSVSNALSLASYASPCAFPTSSLTLHLRTASLSASWMPVRYSPYDSHRFFGPECRLSGKCAGRFGPERIRRLRASCRQRKLPGDPLHSAASLRRCPDPIASLADHDLQSVDDACPCRGSADARELQRGLYEAFPDCCINQRPVIPPVEPEPAPGSTGGPAEAGRYAITRSPQGWCRACERSPFS